MRRLAAVLLLPLPALAVMLAVLALPAHAATASVEVVDNAYAPAEVTVSVGDTVEWTWLGDGRHSVTADPQGALQTRAFDSDPGCSVATTDACRTKGSDPYAWTPSAAGTYTYQCRVHGSAMAGTVTVIESVSTETATEDPSSGGSETQSASEAPTSAEPTSAEPTSAGPTSQPPTSEPASATPSPEPSPPPSTQPTPAPQPSPTPTSMPPTLPTPVAAGGSEADPSAAASTEPEFEQFPVPEITPSPSDAVREDVVAVGAPAGSGLAGFLWRVVGALTVIGTAAAFGRVVLFGAPWDPDAA